MACRASLSPVSRRMGWRLVLMLRHRLPEVRAAAQHSKDSGYLFQTWLGTRALHSALIVDPLTDRPKGVRIVIKAKMKNPTTTYAGVLRLNSKSKASSSFHTQMPTNKPSQMVHHACSQTSSGHSVHGRCDCSSFHPYKSANPACELKGV